MSLEIANNEIRSRAEAFMEAHKWDKALSDWEVWFKSSNDKNQDPNAFHDRAICKFHTGSTDAAIDDLDKAALLQPEYSYRFASRGWMKQSNGDTDGAIADYQRAIYLDPEDAIAHNNLGLLEEAKGYKKQAQERFKISDELQELIDLSKNSIPEEKTINITDKPHKPLKHNTFLGTIKSVFTDKTIRRSWVKFIKDGFTLKE
ncbi:MAG: hypothetical protein COA49_04555 [Bacteroidetes bacterium]|nr:MAG: hypothetical protein COA49_04555 [Bacteroidota bacterium]